MSCYDKCCPKVGIKAIFQFVTVSQNNPGDIADLYVSLAGGD
jgi:hypothetical protein